MADLSTIEIIELPENFLPNPDEDYFVIQKLLDTGTLKFKLKDLAKTVQEYTDPPHDGKYYFKRDGQWVDTIDYCGF